MAPPQTTPTQLTGLYKEIYGDNIEDLLPDSAILQSMIQFSQRNRIGNHYNQPVVVRRENGATYAAAESGAFTLNAARSMITQNAQIQGSQIVMRATMGYDTAARAVAREAAFMSAFKLQMGNLYESTSMRLEIAMLYGGSGLGTTASSTNVNATTTDVVITAATWAAGIWSGFEDAVINFYDNGVIINASTGEFTISTVDPDTRTIRVTGAAADIAALDAAILADPTQVVIYFNGAYGNEMSGLNAIITNTGTMFGINAGTYNLWKGNTYAVNGNLTVNKIMQGLVKPIARGLNEDVQILLNPGAWQTLANDLTALRRFDSSYKAKDGEAGYDSLKFHAQGVGVELISHICVKQGDAFAFPKDRFVRIGATDTTFVTPGTNEEMFVQLADRAGFDYRTYTDQAILCTTPARTLKYTGITIPS